MERRRFLHASATGLAAATAATAAQAQSGPEIRWRLASSFPKSLDTVYGATEFIAKRVAAATGGRFQISVFAAGELFPGPAVLDAVKDGTVQAGQSTSYYYVGKDPTFAFDTAVPFGLNSRQQMAWMAEGGGLQLMREFFATYNIVNIPCGNSGAQMGGWFRKELKSLADLKGLKFRVGGFAGQVLSRLGVVPQQIPGGDIYPALEKGSIDAVEWVGPYDDEKLGLNRVAKYYYYPGWWEGCAQVTLYVNKEAWTALPKDYQAILEMACAEAMVDMQAKYDARNPAALKRLIAAGVQLRPFPRDILDAAYKTTQEMCDEIAGKNPAFAKVYTAWKKFRDDQVAWHGVAERPMDSYIAQAQQAGRSAAKR